MKKVILAAILLAGATSANAESYNHITISYDRQNFSANSDYTGTYWGVGPSSQRIRHHYSGGDTLHMLKICALTIFNRMGG